MWHLIKWFLPITTLDYYNEELSLCLMMISPLFLFPPIGIWIQLKWFIYLPRNPLSTSLTTDFQAVEGKAGGKEEISPK